MKKQILWSFIPVILGCGLLSGQSPIDNSIADYLDDNAVIVIKLSPSQINVDAACDRIMEIIQLKPNEALNELFKELRSSFQELINNFNNAGGGNIYAIFNLDDYPSFFVLTELSDSADVETIKGLLSEIQPVGPGNKHYLDTFERSGKYLFLGKKTTWDRQQTITPAPRWHWWSEYDRMGSSAVKIGIMPSNDHKRVLQEMYPKLPEMLDSLPTTTLTETINWINIDIFLGDTHLKPYPGPMGAFVTIKTSSETKAKMLQETLVSMSQINNIVQLPPPEILHDKIMYHIDIEQLIHPLMPMIQKIRTDIYGSRCMTQLVGLGKAIALYQNDFKESNPPTLEALIETEDVHPKMLVCPKSNLPYVYRGNDLDARSSSSMILIHDQPNYHKDRIHVLYADCHAKALTPAEFLEAIERDNRIRKEHNLPEKQP